MRGMRRERDQQLLLPELGIGTFLHYLLMEGAQWTVPRFAIWYTLCFPCATLYFLWVVVVVS